MRCTFSVLCLRQLSFQLFRIHTVDRNAALSCAEGISNVLFRTPLISLPHPLVWHKHTSSTNCSTLRLIASSPSGAASGGKSRSTFCLAAAVTFAIRYVRSYHPSVEVSLYLDASVEQKSEYSPPAIATQPSCAPFRSRALLAMAHSIQKYSLLLPPPSWNPKLL